jgi:hypothetical protein
MAQHEPLSEEEEKEVEERSAPRAKIVHAAVSKQGEDEMQRPLGSLFWSGVAAGIAIMASVWAEAGLHHKLAGVPGREALSGLGYTLGFLIVILGRMQLFTEQTMVPLQLCPRRTAVGDRICRQFDRGGRDRRCSGPSSSAVGGDDRRDARNLVPATRERPGRDAAAGHTGRLPHCLDRMDTLGRE